MIAKLLLFAILVLVFLITFLGLRKIFKTIFMGGGCNCNESGRDKTKSCCKDKIKHKD